MKHAALIPQAGLSEVGAAYARRALEAGSGVDPGLDIALGDDPAQRLVVHRAAEANGDVLVFFHGGGWTHGVPEWMDFMARPLTARGVTFVSAGYRLAPAHVFPANLDDAAAAVAWACREAGRHGGDVKRIFLGGHSAGGHLAALLAVTAAWRERLGVPRDAVRGCLPVSGVYDFGAGSGLSARPRFLGPAEPHDAAAVASPLAQVDAAVAPPFLMTWGERDFPHLIAQAGHMAEALGMRGIGVDGCVLAGCDHFDASLACGTDASGWPARACAWMRAQGRDADADDDVVPNVSDRRLTGGSR